MESRTTLKLFVIIGVVGLLLLGNGIFCINNGGLSGGVAFCQPEEEEEPVQARPRPDAKQYQGQQGPSGAQIIGDSGKPKMIGDTGRPNAMPAPIPTPPPPKDDRTKMIGDTGNPSAMPRPIPTPPPPPKDSRTRMIGDTGKPSVMDDGEHGTPSVMDDGNHGDGMTTMQPALGTQPRQPATPQHNPNWKENTSIPR